MVQINVDVQTKPAGQIAIVLQLVGLTADYTQEELRVSEDLYAAIAVIARRAASQSGGKIQFELGPN